ncbi:MAG: NAD+ synthase [Candidatus Omnitrophica bacterium]|jgi:NAD+ synthase|nr:NAD+ synthase [Candidatus Omnitrophota bacterium]
MKKKIINWMRSQVKQAGAKGIILGLSGGIDSALVAALSKEAVGKNKVLGLMMPIQSNPQDLKDALLTAKALGISYKIVDLSKVYKLFFHALPKGNKLALGNLKPRLRMMTLYYFANTYGYLVSGTGNKSELSVGYFTKYGDGGTDILPIADLLKKDVRRLSWEMGIPEKIITKAPTAGLWPGQTDEGEMGITYNELDGILECMENKSKPKTSKQKVDKVKKMMACSLHKRQGPKICYLKAKNLKCKA